MYLLYNNSANMLLGVFEHESTAKELSRLLGQPEHGVREVRKDSLMGHMKDGDSRTRFYEVTFNYFDFTLREPKLDPIEVKEVYPDRVFGTSFQESQFVIALNITEAIEKAKEKLMQKLNAYKELMFSANAKQEE